MIVLFSNPAKAQRRKAKMKENEIGDIILDAV